ncbi:O-phospho-L-seryl-tRNA:Cys-tRNA synthase [Patescibacteria group bacterium]|nr:O-phospho-L-seryl-tRNA:Cys-tRNA synthase [Patescibacteria group bacterium]MBU1663430.1 O-phospho-L-seryl-tRNA:Cys-tRNA synthase [Patescibacteria group bacterium]MBU1933646.1 O-phospho-L-seryl-tRNA:Cys-tRNA synthase [Patescibacteria group bacterium]
MTKDSVQKFINLKRGAKGMINIDPLQAGGILTDEARQALLEWGDGFSVCDFCPGRLEEIKKPPIYDFVHKALPEFIGADIVHLTHGAREGKFLIMHALARQNDFIIIDKNAHYTTYVAAERAGLNIKIVENSGYPDFKIDVNDYEKAIAEIQNDQKDRVALIVLTYPDGNYGNLPDAKKLATISKKHKIPLLLNTAYAVGRMPVNMNEIGADFVVASGHKSMASSGPIGFVGMKKEWDEVLFKKSQYFAKKEVGILGCVSRGTAIMTLMASFPSVVERIKEWPKQVEKAQWFSEQMEKLGLKQLGEKPHQHDLMFFESEKLYEISKIHKNGAFFLYKELKKKNIWGIKPGLTKNFKLSTFAATKEELEKVINVFAEILKN